MTFVETLVFGLIIAICTAGAIRWRIEKRHAEWQRLQDKWEDGWPS